MSIKFEIKRAEVFTYFIIIVFDDLIGRGADQDGIVHIHGFTAEDVILEDIQKVFYFCVLGDNRFQLHLLTAEGNLII